MYDVDHRINAPGCWKSQATFDLHQQQCPAGAQSKRGSISFILKDLECKIFSFRTPRRAILKEYLSFESPGNYVFARIPEVRSRHKALLTPKSKAGFLEAIRDRIFQGTMLPESGMSGDCIPSDSMIRSI